jgi:hypothetical protein
MASFSSPSKNKRHETTMTLRWITEQLEMRTPAYLANCLRATCRLRSWTRSMVVRD